MSDLPGRPPALQCDDPSLSDVNQNMLDAWRVSRPRRMGDGYSYLLNVLGDPYLSEMIWILYGKDSLRAINHPIKALNDDRMWWMFWRERNTVVSLARSREGKERVWRMLHDASAWL